MEINDLNFLKVFARGKVRRGGMQLLTTHYEAVMAEVAQYTDDPDVILAAYLHDFLEDKLMTKCMLSKLVSLRVYCMVRFLTRLDDETSEEHMERISKSNMPELYLIKYADSKNNSIYTPMEAAWHVDHFGKPVALAIEKYINRSDMFYRMWRTASVNAVA